MDYSCVNIKRIEHSQTMATYKSASRIKKILLWLEKNELQERKNTCAIISTLKQDIVKYLLLETRLKRSISSKEKSYYLIKVSQ